MKYSDAIDYINSFGRFSHKATLDRIKKLMSLLDHPENGMDYIHIAGTNGKGSVAVYIASVLSHSGKKCGLYTSPYIYDFTERITVDGSKIGKKRFASAISKIIAAGADPSEYTQFEIITAAAFLCFKKEKCSVVVLETGLGGRYDATSVITHSLCSVITSVSLDHTDVLGDTVEKIADEKLGIIIKDVPTVISGKNKKSVLDLAAKRAKENNSDLIIADVSAVKDAVIDKDGVSFAFEGVKYRTGMTGTFQLENAVTALKVINTVYPDMNVKAIEGGLFSAKLPCRFEKISENPLVIADGGHNESGIKALSENIKLLYPDRKIFSVVAMCEDKDYVTVSETVAKMSETVFVTSSGNLRSLSPSRLAEEIKKNCKKVYSYENPKRAFRKALKLTKQSETPALTVVCGSLYLPKAVFGKLGKIKH